MSFMAILGSYSESVAQFSSSSGQSHYASVQVFRLKAWTIMSKNEWRDVIYRFHDFQEGRIMLQGGFSPTNTLMLNFNIYEERVEIISEQGDTTTFENSAQIKLITMGEHIFYNDFPSGYVEQLNQTPVALGAKHQLKVMMESGAGEQFAATDYHNLTSRFDRLYIKKDSYFFIGVNEKLYPASLPSILKLFQDSKNQIKDYTKENKINFKVKDDLIRLLDFTNGLK